MKVAAALEAHVTEIVVDKDGLETGGDRYGWVCSCERRGPWKLRVMQARQGASKHVSGMERGR